MDTALVSQIQHFSVGDGPGIRTTVFFQGCNLHCPWCHNPETISRTPKLLYYASRCTGCGRCGGVCPLHTIADGAHSLERSACTACGRCAAVCPFGALEMSGHRRTLAELMAELTEDRDFYVSSGGGVTLSGGEPLLQADFCAALAHALTDETIPVLLDTAGCVPYAAFEKVRPYLSLCYFDLKAATQDGYDTVGGNLALVMDNMRRLCADGVPTVARIPVIPGFNDDAASRERMAALLADAGVLRVDLLPFHSLGSGKYHALSRTYAFADTPPLEPAAVEAMMEPFRRAGLSVARGG